MLSNPFTSLCVWKKKLIKIGLTKIVPINIAQNLYSTGEQFTTILIYQVTKIPDNIHLRTS